MTGPVSVRPDQVSAGVASFDAAAARLAATVQTLSGAILDRSGAGTWGADAAGAAAAAAYQQGGGPETILFGPAGGGGIVAALGQVGPAVQATVAALTATDQQNAAALPSADRA